MLPAPERTVPVTSQDAGATVSPGVVADQLGDLVREAGQRRVEHREVGDGDERDGRDLAGRVARATVWCSTRRVRGAGVVSRVVDGSSLASRRRVVGRRGGRRRGRVGVAVVSESAWQPVRSTARARAARCRGGSSNRRRGHEDDASRTIRGCVARCREPEIIADDRRAGLGRLAGLWRGGGCAAMLGRGRATCLHHPRAPSPALPSTDRSPQ